MDGETHEERSKRIFREMEERQRKEEAAWHPADSLERTAWNVVGCWQMLVSEVNFAYFHSAGPGASPLEKVTLPAKIRKAAEHFGVRWPHDDWSAGADLTSKVRHKLAHLLYIDSVTDTKAAHYEHRAYGCAGRAENHSGGAPTRAELAPRARPRL
ncbi:hypothetical protein [Nocardia sp. Marseille-Q1738]